MSLFQKAARTQTPLKIGIDGPSGSGKTKGALALATALAAAQGKRVALIDSEMGSASLYADEFDFDTVSIEHTTPEEYARYIKAAAREGYVVVVDSLSHAWQTLLDEKLEEEKANPRVNAFSLWAKYTPRWDALTATILRSPADILVTLRSKQAYELADGAGKKSVVKLGMAPVVRDGFEYELSLVFSLLMSHRATATKDRTGLFQADRLVDLCDAEMHAELLAWRAAGKTNPRLEVLGDVRARAAALRGRLELLPTDERDKAARALAWVDAGGADAPEPALRRALDALEGYLASTVSTEEASRAAEEAA